jgi:hypothetical protein
MLRVTVTSVAILHVVIVGSSNGHCRNLLDVNKILSRLPLSVLFHGCTYMHEHGASQDT